MGYTHTLINPTPMEVVFPFDRGVKIRIPADGEVDISIEQMNDFLPGKDGSETVRQLMDSYGIFLADTDRSYDAQALQAIRACRASKKSQFDAFVDRIRRSPNGPVAPDLLEETIEQAGYAKIRSQIEKLDARIKHLNKVVDADPTRGQIRETLDPSRTCFVTSPPRQFPSKSAMEMFLMDNPEIKGEHDAYWAQINDAKKATKAEAKAAKAS